MTISILPDRGVEAFADELGQFANGVRLGQEISVREQRGVFSGHAGTVAAGINDLEGRVFFR